MLPGDRNLFKAAGWVATEILQALARTVWRLILPAPYPSGPDEPWYRKPGLGIMYQIEYRPGMDWDRDYEEFNRSMMDDEGKLDFNGPFCRIDEWVELSTLFDPIQPNPHSTFSVLSMESQPT